MNIVFRLFVKAAFVAAIVLPLTATAGSKVPVNQIIRVATFNVSMEAGNYKESREAKLDPQALRKLLATGEHQQIKNIAEIIQRIRPDIILLNEFDYIDEPQAGVLAFQRNYLAVGQNGAEPINFPYFYTNTVNTGEPSPFDISGDGVASGTGDDAYGYGLYPGQYGMLVLSKYPIDVAHARTFQNFLWHKMPSFQLVKNPDGSDFFGADTFAGLRLSSKSHWDLPIQIGSEKIHLLAAHPTPPVFDGPEDRNGARNYDEIRMWADYIADQGHQYLVDDKGQAGGLGYERFVIVGDYNASPNEGDSRQSAIQQLLNHPKVNASRVPQSDGGRLHSPDNSNGVVHTAAWRSRVDYVLPSKLGLEAVASEVFWPAPTDHLSRLVKDRAASSDHRLVWLDVKLTGK